MCFWNQVLSAKLDFQMVHRHVGAPHASVILAHHPMSFDIMSYVPVRAATHFQAPLKRSSIVFSGYKYWSSMVSGPTGRKLRNLLAIQFHPLLRGAAAQRATKDTSAWVAQHALTR